MSQTYLAPTPESGKSFFMRGVAGKVVMLIEQASPSAFMAFASNAGYLAGMGHRTAALEDSRLLPLEEGS